MKSTRIETSQGHGSFLGSLTNSLPNNQSTGIQCFFNVYINKILIVCLIASKHGSTHTPTCTQLRHSCFLESLSKYAHSVNKSTLNAVNLGKVPNMNYEKKGFAFRENTFNICSYLSLSNFK